MRKPRIDRYPVGEQDEGRRLDRVLRLLLREVPLSAIHRALREGSLRVNGARTKPTYRCRRSDVLDIPASMRPGAPETEAGQTGSLAVQDAAKVAFILESRDLLVADKPRGILVHGGPGSLDSLARQKLETVMKGSLAFTPGPLHRLDRNTSGLVALSASIEGARKFSQALKDGLIRKTYLAVLEGRLPSPCRWDDLLFRDRLRGLTFAGPAGDADPGAEALGKASLTIRPLLAMEELTFAAISLETGRTHQIRAQAAFHGHPLSGDGKYGSSDRSHPYFLHAWTLSAPEIGLDCTPFMLRSPLPDDFARFLETRFDVGAEKISELLDDLAAQGG